MLERYIESFVAHLVSKKFQDNDELFLYLVSYVATFTCFGVHFLLFLLFAVASVPTFIVMNTVSLIVYSSLLLLLLQRKYYAVGVIIAIEVGTYTLLTSILSGLASHIIGYYMLVLIMQSLFPYGTVHQRIGVVACVLLAAAAGVVVSFLVPPAIVLSPGTASVFLVFNIFLLFFGSILQILVGNLAQRVVARFNETRMQELKDQANTDPLTGLHNRRYAERYFQELPSKNFHACVAMLDIDDFKGINDTYGHDAGDEVLRYIANFLTSYLRGSDIVFRWGGEEFLLVLSGVDVNTAYGILDNIRECLSTSEIQTAQGTLHLTVTIGLSVLDTDNPYVSIRNSDKMLYEGKRSTKNVVVA